MCFLPVSWYPAAYREEPEVPSNLPNSIPLSIGLDPPRHVDVDLSQSFGRFALEG